MSFLQCLTCLQYGNRWKLLQLFATAKATSSSCQGLCGHGTIHSSSGFREAASNNLEGYSKKLGDIHIIYHPQNDVGGNYVDKQHLKRSIWWISHLVGGFNPFGKILVKMRSSSAKFGVKKLNIFELPPTGPSSSMYQTHQTSNMFVVSDHNYQLISVVFDRFCSRKSNPRLNRL